MDARCTTLNVPYAGPSSAMVDQPVVKDLAVTGSGRARGIFEKHVFTSRTRRVPSVESPTEHGHVVCVRPIHHVGDFGRIGRAVAATIAELGDDNGDAGIEDALRLREDLRRPMRSRGGPLAVAAER